MPQYYCRQNLTHTNTTQIHTNAAAATTRDKVQIPLCRLSRDVRDKPVTSPLAQIKLRRSFPVRGSFGEVGVMAFVLNLAILLSHFYTSCHYRGWRSCTMTLYVDVDLSKVINSDIWHRLHENRTCTFLEITANTMNKRTNEQTNEPTNQPTNQPIKT